MAPVTLPPGFRFHPTDEELVAYYLDRKITGRSIELEIIPEVDLYKCEPWDLPDKSYLPSKDMEWYFYSPRDRKYPNGSRTNRATRAGYWKATGKDRAVYSLKKPVGMKKTLVYYRGRAPHGSRTNWVMHEYRLVQSASSSTVSSLKDSYALCRVFKKAINVPKTEVQKAGSENELSVWALNDDLLISDIETSGRRGNGEDNLDGEYSKFPSETSSSDLTDGTPANEIASADDLQAPFASDEANSSSEFYPLHANSFLNPIQDIQMPDCTSLQHLLAYPPLALEDFPQINMEKTKTSKLEHVNGYMNYKEYMEYITDTSITLEEIFSLCSSQETSIVLPMQG